jgi:hypothetical protein
MFLDSSGDKDIDSKNMNNTIARKDDIILGACTTFINTIMITAKTMMNPTIRSELAISADITDKLAIPNEHRPVVLSQTCSFHTLVEFS